MPGGLTNRDPGVPVPPGGALWRSPGWVTLAAVGLKGFERRLERVVEGVFARVFKSGLRPVELGRRLAREMDDQRSVDVRGRTVAPNSLHRLASATDDHDALRRDRRHPRPRAVRRRPRARPRRGLRLPRARSRSSWSIEPSAAHRHLRHRGPLPRGPRRRRRRLAAAAQRRPLRPAASTSSSIGRLPECDITLDDPNVSRRHAEIRPRGDGFVLVDLGSTNGTRVNGVRGRRARAARRRRARLRQHPLLHVPRPSLGSRRVRRSSSPSSSSACWRSSTCSSSGSLRAVWAEVRTPSPAAGRARGRRPRGRRPPRAQGAQGPGQGGQGRARSWWWSSPPTRPGARYPLGARGHHRSGRRLPDHRRRHLRLPAPRPRLPARRRSRWSRTSAPPTAPT